MIDEIPSPVPMTVHDQGETDDAVWCDPDFEEPDFWSGHICARTMTTAMVHALPKDRIRKLMRAAEKYAEASFARGILNLKNDASLAIQKRALS